MKLPRTTGIMAQAGARRCWGLLGAVVSIPLLVGPVGAQQTSAQAGGELAVKTVRQIEALLAAKEQRTPARSKGSSQLLPARQPEAYGVERRQAKGEGRRGRDGDGVGDGGSGDNLLRRDGGNLPLQ